MHYEKNLFGVSKRSARIYLSFFFSALIINYLPDLAPHYVSLFAANEMHVVGSLKRFEEICRDSPRGELECRTQYHLPNSVFNGAQAIGLGVILYPTEARCSDDQNILFSADTEIVDGRVTSYLRTYQVIDLRNKTCRGDLIITNWSQHKFYRHGYSQAPVTVGTFYWIHKVKRLVELSIESLLAVAVFAFLALLLVLKKLQKITKTSLTVPPFDDFRYFWLAFIFISSGFTFDLLVPVPLPFSLAPRLANFFGMIAIVGPTTQYASMNPRYPKIREIFSNFYNFTKAPWMPVAAIALVTVSYSYFRLTYPWIILAFALLSAAISIGNANAMMCCYSIAATSDAAKILMVPGLPASRLTVTYMLFIYIFSMRQQILALESNAKLEAGTELATQLAHDIRSPLAAIQTVLPLTKGEPEVQQLLHSSLRRLKEITESLLESQRGITLQQPVETPDLVQCLNLVLTEAETRYQAIKIELISPTVNFELRVQANGQELRRLFSNILNNAAEAIHHSHGKITVGIEQFEHTFVVTFSDNGSGIDPAIIDSVTIKGFTTKSSSGNGLGLFHAKRLLAAWGGDLQITSSPTTGTTVQLSLLKAS